MKNIYCLLLLLLISCNSLKKKCTYDSHIPVEPVSNIWKISKKGHPTSYIIGSFHFGKPNSVLPINIKNIIQKSNVVVTEIPFNLNSPDSKYKEYLNSTMDYNSGKKLYDKIGYKLFNKIIIFMKQHNFMKKYYKNNQNIPDITFMQPWAVMPLLELYVFDNFDFFKGVDTLINREATLQNKKLDYLENMMDIQKIYSIIPLKYIISMLNSIDYYNLIQQYFNKAYEDYYINGNYKNAIDVLLSMNDGTMSTSDVNFFKCFMANQLLYFRNKQWEDKILTLLAQDKTLIVVGMLHLFSSSGLIKILQNNGYSVTPIHY